LKKFFKNAIYVGLGLILLVITLVMIYESLPNLNDLLEEVPVVIGAAFLIFLIFATFFFGIRFLVIMGRTFILRDVKQQVSLKVTVVMLMQMLSFVVMIASFIFFFLLTNNFDLYTGENILIFNVIMNLSVIMGLVSGYYFFYLGLSRRSRGGTDKEETRGGHELTASKQVRSPMEFSKENLSAHDVMVE